MEKIVEVPEPHIVEKIIKVPVEKIVEKVTKVPEFENFSSCITAPRVSKDSWFGHFFTLTDTPQNITPTMVLFGSFVQVPVERIVRVPVEQIVRKVVEVEVPVEKIVEKIVHIPVEKIVEVGLFLSWRQ